VFCVKTATFRSTLLLILAGISACNRGQGPSQHTPEMTSKPHSADPNSEITVEQILSNPQAYSHRLVKVRGCHLWGFEFSTFVSCDAIAASFPGKIWLVDAETVRQEEYFRSFNPPNPPMQGPESVHLLFHDDAQREDAARRNLDYAGSSRVLILAQFETTGGTQRRFGHLGGFSHELILVDVLHRL